MARGDTIVKIDRCPLQHAPVTVRYRFIPSSAAVRT